MIKELLEKQQPVVYQALFHACTNKRISSAYLFTGAYGTPKYEAAILLAQSILCEHQDGLACETCNTCRRVAEGTYADFIILDGREKSISKEMIDDVQTQFSKTALEGNGQRVYVVLNAENASIAAQNSMLKFLEEPGAGVTAIITTDAINRILPTIISRCTQIPFLPVSEDETYTNLKQQGIDDENAFFLSKFVKDMRDLSNYYDAENNSYTKLYTHIISMLKQFLNTDGLLRSELSVDYEFTYKSQESDTSKARKETGLLLQGFFSLVIAYCHDVIRHDASGITWYDNAVRDASRTPEYYAKLLRIAAEEKDLCNRYNDLNLVMYQTLFRLEELDNERSL